MAQRTTTLRDAEGKVKLTWEKDKADLTPAELIKAFRVAVEGLPACKPTKVSKGTFEDTVTLYPLPDLHIGMLAWEPESGKNWDLAIASDTINEGHDRVITASPPSRVAIVLGLGDLFHADNGLNETARGHNPLSVEGRYAKIYGVVCALLVRRVTCALLKHEKVIVRIMKGNHDEHSAIGAAYYLSAYFRNDPRVTVDLSPDLFWYYRFGKTMLAAHHGHETRLGQMPGVMATRQAPMWGKCTHRYAHLGHLHKSEKTTTLEAGGAIGEIHEAPIAQDDYSHGHGFLSGARLQSITYDGEHGEVSRVVRALW